VEEGSRGRGGPPAADGGCEGTGWTRSLASLWKQVKRLPGGGTAGFQRSKVWMAKAVRWDGMGQQVWESVGQGKSHVDHMPISCQKGEGPRP
jgi:hypothetical protein